MSQVFQFIHFPSGAPAKYGFTEQKLASLRASIIENEKPKRVAENHRDEVWLVHASLFSNQGVQALAMTDWEPITKILIYDDSSKISAGELGYFELILSESEFLAAEASNPYWLLNQLFCQFDLHRQAVQTIEAKFRDLEASRDLIQKAVIELLSEIELSDVQYSIDEADGSDPSQRSDDVIQIHFRGEDIHQLMIAPRLKYNKLFNQIYTLILERVNALIERIELNQQLETVKGKFSRSQKALIQSEKLSVAGKMTAAIAHEINNPLQGVRNCFHLVSNQNVDIESKEKYLEMTNQELDRLTKTVQRMLEFYRPNEEFHTVQLLDVLEHTLNLLHGQLMEFNIKVKSSWPLKVPPIEGIADQIEQVFMNLILNARDFMRDGGTLWINIEVTKPFVTITFEDSGPGVANEFRDKIFEPFVSSKGTAGLGLSVCHEIVSNHQGIIELMDDVEDRGARFKIILPIKQRLAKGINE